VSLQNILQLLNEYLRIMWEEKSARLRRQIMTVQGVFNKTNKYSYSARLKFFWVSSSTTTFSTDAYQYQ
jgi:hypothetical protein